MIPAALLVALCLAQDPAQQAEQAAAPKTVTPEAVPAKPPAAKPPAAASGSDSDDPDETPKPVAKTPAPKPAAAPVAPAAPAGPVLNVTDGTARVARAIIARDIDSLVQLTPAPFSFDGTVARTAAEVRQHWAETLDRHPVERLRLYGVEVLTYDAMVAKYGAPPARLSGVNLKDAKLGIANLGGRATIVAWKHHGAGLTAVAISD